MQWHLGQSIKCNQLQRSEVLDRKGKASKERSRKFSSRSVSVAAPVTSKAFKLQQLCAVSSAVIRSGNSRQHLMKLYTLSSDISNNSLYYQKLQFRLFFLLHVILVTIILLDGLTTETFIDICIFKSNPN